MLANGNKPSDACLELLRRLCNDFATTLPCDMSFQRLRAAERDRPGNQVDLVARRLGSARRKVLSKDSNDTEVAVDAAPELNSTAWKRMPCGKRFFAPTVSKCSTTLKSIKGYGVAPWASFNAASEQTLAGQSELATHCHKHGMDKGPRSWRSALLRPGWLVYNKKELGVCLHFVVHASNNISLLWPAELVKVGKARMWKLKHLTDLRELKWHPVTDFNDWMALPLKAISCAHLFAANGHKLPEPFPATVQMQAAARPIPVLTMAAEAAFEGVSADLISKMLVEEYKVALGPSWKYPEKLARLIMSVLKCSELAACDIIEEKRDFTVDASQFAAAILGSDQIEDVLTLAQLKDKDEMLGEFESLEAERAAIMLHVKTVRSKKGTIRKRAPVKWPSHDSDMPAREELLAKYFPPGFNLLRSTFDARWRVHCKRWSCSRSWGSLGSEWACVKACCVAAWSRAEATLPVACHVEGLS